MRFVVVFWLLVGIAWAGPEHEVVGGVRVGVVRLTSPASVVIKHLGKPVKQQEQWLDFGPRVSSPVSPIEYNFMVQVDPEHGAQTVRTYDTHYRTKQGVGPGSTRLDLRRTYRTALKVLVQTDTLDTLFVQDARGPIVFYVVPSGRVVAVEVSK